MSYVTLMDYTGHESGAVLYDDGSVWVGNWAFIYGVPRQFATGMVGLDDLEIDGELLPYNSVDVPQEAIDAMQAHEQEQGTEISKPDTFRAIKIPGKKIIVVTQEEWN